MTCFALAWKKIFVQFSSYLQTTGIIFFPKDNDSESSRNDRNNAKLHLSMTLMFKLSSTFHPYLLWLNQLQELECSLNMIRNEATICTR